MLDPWWILKDLGHRHFTVNNRSYERIRFRNTTTSHWLPRFVGLLMEGSVRVYGYEWGSSNWDGKHWKKENLCLSVLGHLSKQNIYTQTATRNSLSCFLHSSPVWFLFYLCVVFIWVFILLLAPIFPPKAVESDWCSVHRSKMSSNQYNRLLDQYYSPNPLVQ